jgi:long-chain acyl-CoA synthetase
MNFKPDPDTLPKLLRKLAREYGDRKIALRVKDRGIWKSYTWKDYYERVGDLCLGLVQLGFKRDDKICIIGENKPEWFWAELAAQAAGGIAIGVFTDCGPQEIKYFF